MNAHDPLPGYAGCICGTGGWTSTLACGHQAWSHGPPAVGSYVSCYPALNGFGCQAQRKVLAVQPGGAA